MAAFLDLCRFTPTAGGTTDWTVSSAVTGYVTPAGANAVNGRLYKYRAESANLSEWELGEGAYNTATGVLARTTIILSSNAAAKVNFTSVPQVAVVALKEDLISIEEVNSFTTTQKKQAQSNLLVAPTIQSFLSGSGTYTTPTGCTRIRVRMVGGGGGGGGGGTAVANGTSGGNTTFGTTLLVANGGGNNATGATGGSASLGSGPIGLAVAGTPSGGYTALTTNFLTGGFGGASPFGGAGTGTANAAGSNASANTGSGGGGGGSNNNAGLHLGAAGGGGGGYVDAIINSPSATYAYAVGAAGTGGTAGTDGFAGGNGAAGIIVVEEYYGS